MAKRPPSLPPKIPGFEHVKLLGSGGFADVFLYQQMHPRRHVAVKVLLADKVGTALAQDFTDEANLMAQLSTHPSIVSVYEAGVASDGRPYLVMEYCSKPNLQARHKQERFSEAETLRIGVHIAGAVETAHRAGILHRDIKPANILVTDYGRPALTDFGISATVDSEFSGMSVPWSPPESFRVPPEGDATSDVYSLAATLYTLLANRSPFEVIGGSNGEVQVIGRIQSAPVPPLGRTDVSPSIEAVLQRGMAKEGTARYTSAIEFARALQRVQIELGMQATPIDVIEDDAAPAPGEDDEEAATRYRGMTTIHAQGPVAPVATATAIAPPAASAAAVGLQDSDTVLAPVRTASTSVDPARPLPPTTPPPLSEDTRMRDPEEPLPESTPVQTPRPRVSPLVWVIGGLVALVAVVVVIAVLTTQANRPPIQGTPTSAPVDPGEGVAPQVTDISGTPSGASVTFTWTNPDPQESDTYLWRKVVPGETFPFTETADASASVPAEASGRTCIEIVLRRNGVASADSVTGCAP